MGNKKSVPAEKKAKHGGVPASMMDNLLRKTDFSKKVIAKLYDDFVDEHPALCMNKTEFIVKIQQDILRNADAMFFAEYLFKGFDEDKNGLIDFEEFVTGIFLITNAVKGHDIDRIEFSFRILDYNGDGSITKREMFNLLSAYQTYVGEGAASPKRLTEYIFQQADANCDGNITLEEFTTAAKGNRDIMEYFSF